MNGPTFRTLCHSLGISAQALAKLARVSERSVRHWWGKGTPPAPVQEMVQEVDAQIDRMVAAAVDQADTLNSELPADANPEIMLVAYHDERSWWAAHPRFTGLPVQTHSVILRRTWAALEALGYDVHIEYADAAGEDEA